MAIKEILLLGNPLLRTKCGKVKNFADPVLSRTIDDLRDTLGDFRRGHGFGRGIAAPQIGVTRRIVFVNIETPMALVNPEIVKRSRQTMTLWDDCFSFSDLLVKIRRYSKITVRFQDELGKKQVLDAVGGLSELLQHEIDHVDGILAIDRAIDARHIILRSEWKKLKQSELQNFKL